MTWTPEAREAAEEAKKAAATGPQQMTGEQHTQAIAAAHGISHPCGTASDNLKGLPRLFDVKQGDPGYQSPFSDKEKEEYAAAYGDTPEIDKIEGIQYRGNDQ